MSAAKRAFYEAFSRDPYANLPSKAPGVPPPAAREATAALAAEPARPARADEDLSAGDPQLPGDSCTSSSLSSPVRPEVSAVEAAAPPLPPPEGSPPLPPPAFTACATFGGAWEGHVFKLGDCGLGYYEDRPPPAPPAPRQVNVSEALDKISMALPSAKKLPKAAQLLCALMDAELDSSKAKLFFPVLESAMKSPAGIAAMAAASAPSATGSSGGGSSSLGSLKAPATTEVFVSLSAAAQRKREAFDGSDRVRIDSWGLLLQTAPQLRTDDSWVFAAACRALVTAVERVTEVCGAEKCGGDPVDASSAARALTESILACFRVAFGRYHCAWAQPSVDAAVQRAADRRMLFPAALRSELDGFTTRMHERRRTPAGMAPRTVRKIESTAHPLRNRKADLLR